ncbi:hypothetical protein ACFQL3_01820 [Natronoarchaeum sp. GCM10025321]
MMTETPSPTDPIGIYQSDNTQRQYKTGPAGLRGALESRARRAYDAIVEAEKARQKILELPLEPPLTQLQDPLRDCDKMIQDAIWWLTGRKEVEVTTQAHGARLAAERLPRNPSNAPEIRACAEHLQQSGTTILTQMTHARDSGDFTGVINLYDDLWQAAVKLVGNAAAISDAVSEGFEKDAAEYRLRKNGNWN